MLRVNKRIAIPRQEFSFAFARSSGPGGQHVNKVNTKVTLRWHVAGSRHLPDDVRDRFFKRYHGRIAQTGELVIYSQRFREQRRNIDDCLAKLRVMLEAVAEPPRVRKPTRPTRSSNERRLQAKLNRSNRKQTRRPPKHDD
jgi:ribosome-associated protein